MWQQATAFCARPHYQREVTPVRERSAGQSRLPVSLISSPFLGLALTKTEGSVYVCDGLRLMCSQPSLL